MGWKSRNTTPKPLLFQWISSPFIYVLWLGTQSCLTLCDPMDSSTPDSSVHGESPDKNIGVGCHALLQGIFPSQKSNWELFHCRRILYQLTTERQEVPLRLYTPHNWLVKNKQTNKQMQDSLSSPVYSLFLWAYSCKNKFSLYFLDLPVLSLNYFYNKIRTLPSSRHRDRQQWRMGFKWPDNVFICSYLCSEMLERQLNNLSPFEFNTSSLFICSSSIFFLLFFFFLSSFYALGTLFNSWELSSKGNRLEAVLPSWCLPFNKAIEFEKQIEE